MQCRHGTYTSATACNTHFRKALLILAGKLPRHLLATSISPWPCTCQETSARAQPRPCVCHIYKPGKSNGVREGDRESIALLLPLRIISSRSCTREAPAVCEKLLLLPTHRVSVAHHPNPLARSGLPNHSTPFTPLSLPPPLPPSLPRAARACPISAQKISLGPLALGQ